MQIDTDTMNRLVEMVRTRKESDEVEAIFTGTVTSDRFDTLLQYYRGRGKDVQEEDTLDVQVQLDGKTYRVTATGNDVDLLTQVVAKKAELKPQQAERMLCIVKTLGEALSVQEYDMKITKKHELRVSKAVSNHVFNHVSNNARTMRAKRRISSFSEDKICRVDLTYVNHVQIGSPAEIRYEVEVEIVDRTPAPKTCILSLFKTFSVLLKLISNTNYVLGNSVKRAVLAGYHKLVSRDIPSAVSSNLPVKFLGPKPVTLELQHLVKATPGADSVVENYTVTDKADGERALLYVDEGGSAFLIDDRLNVRNTGLKFAKGDTLLDCEVCQYLRNSTKLIAIFDAYFHEGRDLRGKPLFSLDSRESRISVATLAVVDVAKTRPDDPDVKVKTFRMINNDLFNQVKAMVRKNEAGEIPYETDGMIFTPASYPVGAADETGPVVFQGGRWDKVFKWKPPEFNSIDFLVKFEDVKNSIVVDGDDMYRAANLYVGSKASENPISLLTYVAQMYRPREDKKENGENYVKRLFEAGNTNTLHTALFKISEGGVCRCASGEVINDNTIVEMTYQCPKERERNSPSESLSENSRHSPSCWRPLRIRHDKTERYQMTKAIGSTANDINTALSIWRSICFPIGIDMLTGVKEIESGEVKAAQAASSGYMYYIRNRPREQMASLPMLVFHNQFVKKTSLIMKFKGHALSLFDMGCGRGGDINRWIDAQFTRVVGIDPVNDNLTNPGPVNEGACSRALSAMKKVQSQGSTRVPKIVFLRMDASRIIDSQYIASLREDDPETHAIASSLWAIEDAKEMPPELKAIHGFATQGFDVVSCMFAVHYFFDTLERLDAFATNVANQLRTGGHFFGACLDGERVAAKLSQDRGQDHGQGQDQERNSIEGRSADGRLLWSINKLYDSYETKKKEKEKKEKKVSKKKKSPEPADLSPESLAKLGRRIRVFVESIGHPLDEFLMDYDVLREIMASKGLYPLSASDAGKLSFSSSTGFFDELFGDMMTRREPGNLEVAMQMSQAEKEYSFMHRWFVFTKR